MLTSTQPVYGSMSLWSGDTAEVQCQWRLAPGLRWRKALRPSCRKAPDQRSREVHCLRRRAAHCPSNEHWRKLGGQMHPSPWYRGSPGEHYKSVSQGAHRGCMIGDDWVCWACQWQGEFSVQGVHLLHWSCQWKGEVSGWLGHFCGRADTAGRRYSVVRGHNSCLCRWKGHHQAVTGGKGGNSAVLGMPYRG